MTHGSTFGGADSYYDLFNYVCLLKKTFAKNSLQDLFLERGFKLCESPGIYTLQKRENKEALKKMSKENQIFVTFLFSKVSVF